ncbi:MAG: hypothetical protein ACRDGR_00020 [bacterium]
MKRTFSVRQFALLFVLCLGVFGAQSQCSRVADDVMAPTGSLVGAGGGDDDCTDDCDRVARRARKDEDKQFGRNIRNCERDRRRVGKDEVACLQSEAERHREALQSIATTHADCIAECGGFGEVDDCIEFCEREGRRQEKEERKIHKKILRACRGGSDDDDDDDDDDDGTIPGGTGGGAADGRSGGEGNNPCSDAENARYEAALADIEAWVEECASRCHDQGGGGAGQ